MEVLALLQLESLAAGQSALARLSEGDVHGGTPY
jgi:hypothetical protein